MAYKNEYTVLWHTGYVPIERQERLACVGVLSFLLLPIVIVSCVK
jgi:hypothetical protein